VEKLTLEGMGIPEFLSKQGEPEHLLTNLHLSYLKLKTVEVMKYLHK
jgi:hypothetical protein